MNELSVFIDESGDFGEVQELPAYYLVTFVFHDQNKDISDNVKKLEKSTHSAGFDIEYIHTGPLIRREEIFSSYTINDRRKLLYKMLNFVVSCPINYMTIAIDQKKQKIRFHYLESLAVLSIRLLPFITISLINMTKSLSTMIMVRVN